MAAYHDDVVVLDVHQLKSRPGLNAMRVIHHTALDTALVIFGNSLV